MAHQGFFSLQSVQDLLAKARSDLACLRANPTDPYLAYNFFVAARHVPDWIHPKNRKASKALIDSYVELQVCRHLADGAKHLQLEATQHTQVERTTESAGIFDSAIFDSAIFDTGRLIVELSPKDAPALGLSSSVSALELAELVMHRLDLICAI